MNRNITIKLLNALEKGSRRSKHISTKEYITNHAKIKAQEKAKKWLYTNNRYINIYSKNNTFWITELDKKKVPSYVVLYVVDFYKQLGYNYIGDVKININ